MEDRDRIRELHESLDRRRRPEDVAELVLGALDDLNRHDLRTIQKVAGGSLKRGWWGFGFSSMSDDFRRPAGFERQLDVAEALFRVGGRPAADDPAGVRGYLVRAEATIAKSFGSNDFLADRLSREGRAAVGLDLSKRQYNKRFRLAARMEAKLDRLEREREKRELTLISKSRLASQLSWEEFSADRNSACFVAYYTARCNLRSEFTIAGQQKPFDQVCGVLMNRCKASSTTNWWAVAHALPDRDVLDRLNDARKGELLGRWFRILERLATLLRQTWERSRFDRRTMIVRKGDDSTTWNATAGAWNKARDAWISLSHALNMDEALERMCVGKVMRLMAADVAAWHRMTGGGLDPDTLVWADLPAPWDVLAGAVECPRSLVEKTCVRRGVDPVARGWTAPRPGRAIQEFRPTPELVHGVTVGHPGLALTLRKLGVFSGKELKIPEPL